MKIITVYIEATRLGLDDIYFVQEIYTHVQQKQKPQRTNMVQLHLCSGSVFQIYEHKYDLMNNICVTL